MDYGEGAIAARSSRAEHPGSALRRKHRLERLAKSSGEPGVPAAAEQMTFESPMRASGTVRIPADEWVLELALKKGQLFLRLISSKKGASVNDIRVRVAKQNILEETRGRESNALDNQQE